MVHVNVHSQEAMNRAEMHLATTIIGIMSTNPIFFEEKEALVSDGLTLHYQRYDENGEIEEKEEVCPYEHFLATVNKSMNTTLTMTIDTPEGQKSQTVPFMPVTLIDMPMLKKAWVTLDASPSFLPRFDDGKLSFKFKDELYEFAMEDMDTDENDTEEE